MSAQDVAPWLLDSGKLGFSISMPRGVSNLGHARRKQRISTSVLARSLCRSESSECSKFSASVRRTSVPQRFRDDALPDCEGSGRLNQTALHLLPHLEASQGMLVSILGNSREQPKLQAHDNTARLPSFGRLEPLFLLTLVNVCSLA